jgi:HD-like signal output (HDOD) protein
MPDRQQVRFPFFWRSKPSPQPDPFAMRPEPPSETPQAPDQAEVAAAAPQLAALRQVYALALHDERAAQPTTASDPAQTNLLLAASQALAQIGVESRYTPRQPSMLAQLLEALSDDEASLRELSRIVSKDPQLTGNLLRSANSPLYRVSSSPVESVERAAAVLGTTGMRTLLAASLMQPLASGPTSGLGRFGEIIWEHSLYSASAAEAWAGRKSNADPFTANLLGLMHGLGCVAVFRVLSDLYAARPGMLPDPATIADALETNAAVTATRIAAHWGLSERTQQALESQSSAAPVNARSALSQALQFGLLAGAMTILCRKGKLTEEAGLAAIEAGGFPGEPAPRIWNRLLLAYGRP